MGGLDLTMASSHDQGLSSPSAGRKVLALAKRWRLLVRYM